MSLTKRLGVTFVLIAAVAAIAVGSVKAASVSVRVGVYDDTERRPMPEKAEIWIRGLGSWWIVRETVKNVPERQVGAVDTIFVYPDGRSGKEISVRFKITTDMCPQGCARDLISVAISDTEVSVQGTPIDAANDEFDVILKRR